MTGPAHITGGATVDDDVDDIAGPDAERLGVDLAATIRWAVAVGTRIAPPGEGRTAQRWSALATAAAHDVTAARVLEPHVDALAILAEAVDDGAAELSALDPLGVTLGSSWGVYAAEGGQRLEAARTPQGSWLLSGTKPWCSLAAELSHALVTAWVSPTERRLFAVALRDGSVVPHAGPWVSRGLSRVVSAPIDFRDTPAVAIGGDGWYLRRPGFAWGGMGVAAVWWGGTGPLRDALRSAASRDGADQLASTLLGDADAASWSARAVLADAARRVDSGPEDGVALLAERVRAVVAATTERTLAIAERALGPGPLTTDEGFARRVADLRIYVRQHHAERDLARLGRLIVAAP